MFKELRNEAIYRFHLQTDSPFVIKSGEENILDPSLPDGQVLRSYHNRQPQVVIPGSSVKGVFRSRTEQLMKTMGHTIHPFKHRPNNRDDAKTIYHTHSDIAQRLFGSTALKGRIYFQDAFPLSGTKVVTGLRHGVGINRITGGAEKNVKFDTEVVEQATFQVEIRLVNYELWQLALVAWLIQDLEDGFIKIGAMTTRGFGRFRVNELNLSVHEYRPHVQTLCGFAETDTVPTALTWKRSLLKKTCDFSSLQSLIGESGILSEISFPTPEPKEQR